MSLAIVANDNSELHNSALKGGVNSMSLAIATNDGSVLHYYALGAVLTGCLLRNIQTIITNRLY